MKKTFLLFHKLALLVFVASLFSCENPIEIGLDLNGNTSKSYFSDTLSLNVSTILADSSYNGNGTFVVSGNVKDPYTGEINSMAFLQPSLITISTTQMDTFKVASNSVADSVSLKLFSSGLMFGDTLSKSTFGIYRLKSSMATDKRYNRNDRPETESTPLATFKINSASLKNATFDTLVAFYVKLPLSLAKELIALGVKGYNDNTNFIPDFKGFAIKPESDARGAYTFNIGAAGTTTSWIVLNYHTEGDTIKKVKYFDFSGPRHSSIIANRIGTSLSGLSTNNNEISNIETGGFSFAQAGTGLSTKIGFKNLTAMASNLKIEKAVLELQIDNGSATKNFPRIFNYVVSEVGARNQQTRNSSNIPTYLIGSTESVEGAIYSLVDSSNTLSVDLTYFLQNKINKKQDIGSIMIMPGLITSSTGYYGMLANDNLRRAVFRKPKLKLYYTK
jgi:hypothetical protein